MESSGECYLMFSWWWILRWKQMSSFRTLQQVMSHHIPEDRKFSVVINIKVRTTDSSRMLQDGMWYDISGDWKLMHLGIFLAACCINWPYRNFSPCHRIYVTKKCKVALFSDVMPHQCTEGTCFLYFLSWKWR
jgi:hypothetical protein